MGFQTTGYEMAIRTLRTAEYGSAELLDAAESSVDLGISWEEFCAVMDGRLGVAGIDPSGELLGEEYWRDMAGPPKTLATGSLLLGHGGNFGSIGLDYKERLPSVVVDRHRGRPGVDGPFAA